MAIIIKIKKRPKFPYQQHTLFRLRSRDLQEDPTAMGDGYGVIVKGFSLG